MRRGVPVAGVVDDLRGEADRAARGQHLEPARAFRHRGDPRLVRRLGQVDAVPPGQGVGVRHHQVERVVQQRLLVEPRVAHRRVVRGGLHHGQIGGALEEQVEDGRNDRLRDPYRQPWVPLAEPGRQRREQHRDGHREPGHPQHPGGVAVVGAQIQLGLVPAGLDGVGVRQQALGGRGEAHPAALGFEQVDAEVAGELADLLGGGGGREVQGAGGRGDRAVVGDRSQNVEPAQVNHEAEASRWRAQSQPGREHNRRLILEAPRTAAGTRVTCST